MRNTELLIPASSLEVLKSSGTLRCRCRIYRWGKCTDFVQRPAIFAREDMEAGVKFAHEME